MNLFQGRRALAPLVLALFLAGFSRGVLPDKGVSGPSPALEVLAGEEDRARAWSEGFTGVYSELMDNLKMPSRPFRTRYAQPGPAWPDDVYLWDTAFISEVWRLWDVGTAKEVNRGVLDHADDGRLQHVFGSDQRSRDTQPPVMAWSVWQNYSWDRDRDYLAYAYPILRDYNRWLYEKRRHPSGLFCWAHPFESGMDNSPRFASRDVSRTARMEYLAAVDLCSYLVLQNSLLSKMANELGRPDESREFREKARALKDLVNELLWDDDIGIYFDRDMEKGELIRIKTIASLVPLFCGVPDQARARRLRDHIMDPEEFNTPFPLPSVARDEPWFEKDMWRGPVWINTSYMVILGLEDYGFDKEAAELSFRTADRVYTSRAITGEFWEFFDPDRTGIEKLHRKTTLIKVLTGNDKPRPRFVGWTGLVNNLVVERLLGLRKKGEGWELCPRFPAEAWGMRFRVLMDGGSLEFEVAVRESGFEVKRRCGGGEGESWLAAGQCLDLPCF